MKQFKSLWRMPVLTLAAAFLFGSLFPQLTAQQAANGAKLPVRAHDTVFYESFNDIAWVDNWHIFDLNNDGRTWMATIGSGFHYSRPMVYSGNGNTPNDWAISPKFPLKKGITYKLSYFYNMLYFPEKVEVYLGTDCQPEDCNRLLASHSIEDFGWTTVYFEVSADNEFCVGFKAATVPPVNMPGLFIDEVSITEEVDVEIPAPVQNLVQVPGQNGATTMSLKWSNPDKTQGGQTLSSLTGIEIYKNGGDVAESYSLSLVPGAAVEWADPNPLAGKVSYTVYAVNETGRSYGQTVNTFIGEDLPSAPQGLSATHNAGVVSLQWQAPSEFGLNGGWYNKTGLSYLVTRQGYNSSYKVVAAKATSPTLTDTVSDLDHYLYYVTAQNSHGKGVSAKTDISAGTSLPLPFYEDFENGYTFNHLWTVIDAANDKATWYVDPARGDNSPRCAYWNWLPAVNVYADDPMPEAEDWLITPLFRLEKDKTYKLKFSLAGPMFGSVNLRIYLGKTANVEALNTLLKSFPTQATSGSGSFEDLEVEFTAPATGSFCIGFYYYGYDGNGYCWIDNVSVEGTTENDLSVSLAGSSIPKVGLETTYTATVTNNGTAVARNYKVLLHDDAGNLLAESPAQTRPLSAGRTQNINLSWTPANTLPRLLVATVEWDEDEIESNNKSEVLPVNIQDNGYTAVEVGNGDILSYQVPWYVYNSGFGQTVYQSNLLGGVTGKLHGFSWQVVNGLLDTLYSQHIRLYVGETDRYDMSAGWFTRDQLQLVFEDAVDIVPGSYDWFFEFAEPFDYKGGNLVVCVEGFNDYGYLGAYGLYFRCTETNWNATSRINYSSSLMDLSNLDNSQGAFRSLRPNATFYFDVHDMGSVSGTVKSDAGTALSNVRITVEGLNAVQRTTAAGAYKFPYLPLGSQKLTYTLVGYADNTQTVAVATDQNTEKDVVMQALPKIKLKGVVAGTDNRGTGLPDIKITFDGPSDYTVTTNETGAFEIADMYGNLDYKVNIVARGYNDYEGVLHVGGTDMTADTIFIERMVNMPAAVRAYDKAEYALIEWDEPVPVAWLQKDNGTIYGGFGGNTDQAYLVGQRYTPEDLKAAGLSDKGAITKIRFVPMAVANFAVQIFMGEKEVESLVYEEDMKVEKYEEWVEYTLTDPVPVDTSNCLIIALKIRQGSGSNPMGFDNSSRAERDADLFSENGGLSWNAVSSVSPSMHYNWLLRAFCSANPNDKPNEVVQLQSTPCTDAKDFMATYGSGLNHTLGTAADREANEFAAPPAEYHFSILPRSKQSKAAKQAVVKDGGSDYTYEVFRLVNGQEKDNSLWIKVNEQPVAERSLRDENWRELPDTMYRYAVRSLLSGVYSPFTFATAVDKGQYAVVSMRITANVADNTEGAKVELRGVNNTHEGVVGADGRASITDVHYGVYKLVISKEGLNTYTQDSIVVNRNEVDLGVIELSEDVRPPRNFTAVDWIDYTEISWDKPARLTQTELTKTNKAFYSGYGMNTGGTMEVGHRYTPEELEAAGVDGFYIESISFWPDASADFALCIWKSDNFGQEKLYYTQPITSNNITLGQWNTVRLDEPVLINSSQYYIFGYSAYMAAGTYPCGVDMGPVVEGGDMIFYDGKWSSFCSFAPAMFDFNWMISVSAANDFTAKNISKSGKDGDEFNYTFNVYRFAQADSANAEAWTKVSPDNLRERTLKDESWKDLEDGNYYYAAYSVSEAGNTSATVLSSLLSKGEVSLVTVNVSTNNGASAEGAEVVLALMYDESITYSGIVGADNSVQIPAVPKNTYIIKIYKKFFYDYSQKVEVNQSKTELSGFILREALDEPIAVRAFKNKDEVATVNWYSPMSTGFYPHYITWTVSDYFTGIGQGANAFSFAAAHLYNEYDLEDMRAKGGYIQKIRFYADNNPNYPTNATFTVCIWEGEDHRQVRQQAVPASKLVLGGWNEVTLSAPYYIEGNQTVMVGYKCNATQGYPGGIDKGPAVRGKGNMICVQDQWMTVTGLSPDLDYNWLIEAYVTDALEAGVENKGAKADDGVDFVKGYNVWRLRKAEMRNPDAWTSLLSNSTETSLTDNLSAMEDDSYLYAVQAIYSTGTSNYAYSEVLNKGVDNEELISNANAALKLMPNPAAGGRFTVEAPFAGLMTIYGLDGRVLYTKTLAEGVNRVEAGALPAGTYIVALRTDKGRLATSRLVIVK